MKHREPTRYKRSRDKATANRGPEVRGIRRPKELHKEIKSKIDDLYPREENRSTN